MAAVGATTVGDRAAIDVWITDPGVASSADRERWLDEWLDEAERARVRDARSPSRQAEIVVGRALLRSAVAAVCGGPSPAGLRFTTAPGGRPSLALDGQERLASAVDVSLAHTRGLAACAVARGGRVGVDAEHRGRRTEPIAIARRFFSAGDAAAVEAAAPGERAERFLERWTLREAYTKVLGVPLLELPGDSVAFGVESSGSVRLEGTGSAQPADQRWAFWLLRPTSGHVLALAWRGGAGEPTPSVTLHRWPSPG